MLMLMMWVVLKWLVGWVRGHKVSMCTSINSSTTDKCAVSTIRKHRCTDERKINDLITREGSHCSWGMPARDITLTVLHLGRVSAL